MRDDLIETLHARIDLDGDPESHLVLADLLTERGDLRGELIVLQHALATEGIDPLEHKARERRHNKLLNENLWQLTGLGPRTSEGMQFHWRLGYIECAEISWASNQKSLGILLTHPGSRHLRALTISGAYLKQELLHTLSHAAVCAPATLSSLTLGNSLDEHPTYWVDAHFSRKEIHLSLLWAIFSEIESLRLDLGAVSLHLGDVYANRLRRFEWVTPYLSRDELSPLVSAQWPALEELRVWTGTVLLVNEEDDLYDAGLDALDEMSDEDGEGISDPDTLEPLFARLDTLEHLHTVGFPNCQIPWGDLATAAAAHGFWERLHTLDVSRGRLPDEQLGSFVAACRSSPRLQQLDADKLRVSEQGWRHIHSALPGVQITGEPHAPAEIERFLYVVTIE